MAFRLAEDLNCPICQDIFNNPVVLSCSHSFCNDCIKSWWRGKQKCECPVCKRASSRKPPRNLALRNLCETFSHLINRKDSEGTLCPLHFEGFKLYCLDHQQPACVVCRDSHAHVNHRFRPIHEIAQERREQVQMRLAPMREELRLLKQAKDSFSQTEEHMKTQARQTEEKIKGEFRKLTGIILKEEKARITALKREEKRKTTQMSGKIGAVSQEITALSDAIGTTEEELKADDVSFLRSYESAVLRLQRPLLEDTGMVSGALIDVAKHLRNLTYPVLNKMKEQIRRTPVVLDPNTAHPHLILSEDLTSVRYGRRQKLPQNPERISYYRCVLGSEGFYSGSHSWDVQVGDNGHWLLGVAAEWSYRTKRIKSGLWILKFHHDQYSAVSPTGEVRLYEIQARFKTIRVDLDCKRGQLSFSDPEAGVHIYTFTHTFTTTLFPYFSNGKRSPLRILPVPDSTSIPPVMKILLLVMMMIIITLTLFLIVLLPQLEHLHKVRNVK